MKIIVTGGNGFLGSNLIRKLLLEGHIVYAFSNQTTNILDILNQIKFDFSHTDNLNSFENKIKAFEPDIVIHCGWSGGNNYNDVNNINQFYENIQPSIDFLLMLSKLSKKPKTGSTWATVGTYTSGLDGTIAINPVIDTTYWDIKFAVQGDTMNVGKIISVADAQKVNQFVLGTATPTGFDFYTADVNNSNTISSVIEQNHPDLEVKANTSKNYKTNSPKS